MKILFVASEAVPYVKAGGLGDVAGSLPRTLAKTKGVEICVFVPLYKKIRENTDIILEHVSNFEISLAWRREHVGIYKAKSKSKKLSYYFIDSEHYFYRDDIYGYHDDGERFAYFSLAVVKATQILGMNFDIIHCNDWQTALIPIYKKALGIKELEKAKTVFTIHNIEYQGKMPIGFFDDVIGVGEEYRNLLTYDGCINLMKGAIVACDKLTTVSKTYAEEILHSFYAHGLENILKENSTKLCGIVNGIDTDYYNPENSDTVFDKFSSEDISGKAKNKEALQKLLGLPINPDVPIVAMVSRLVSHKGLDLVECVMNDIMQRDLQFVAVGTGDGKYMEMFSKAASSHASRMSANMRFDKDLANKVYAGADMFLMPSKSEPCGLSQLIAMRYGTVPIVRETGGLRDTVTPLDINTLSGRGFTFKSYNAHDMLDAIDRALSFYRDGEKWNAHVKNLIKYNSGWSESVKEYLKIYGELCN